MTPSRSPALAQALLSVARVGLAFTTTVEMFKTGTFPEFASKFKILFTSGLFLSAITDVLVSVARYYYLRNLKQGYSQTQEVVDSVVVYTINDGLLTCAVVIASIVCVRILCRQKFRAIIEVEFLGTVALDVA
ncbi:hypothetical protein OF83DRAFT_1180908 [Amylostereum chailletii]|nr:hypothetical protein OF83DRAFT_1180908 [Amylostereum chailletii]